MNYQPRTSTDWIAVHCAATKASLDIGEKEIALWHKQRGWEDIGYNVVIRRNGLIEIGRPIDYAGAHVAGFNTRSLGVCVVGGLDDAGKAEDNFTDEQRASLLIALRFLKRYAPLARIQGHRDFPNVAKDCPSFDVRQWLGEVAPELL